MKVSTTGESSNISATLTPAGALKAAKASFIGTSVEWYDYFLYGVAAAAIFPRIFFNNLGDTASLLASLATFGVAFLCRPLGGLLFGHLGDRVSRKTSLVLTLMIMGGSTFFIGVLPTVDQVGIWAPILLILLRLGQGIGLGGEWGGAALLVVEHSPPKKRGFYSSAAQLGVPAGQLLASGIFALVTLLPEDQLFSWGWRIPFLLSGVMVLIGIYIRTHIPEPEDFKQLKESTQLPKAPILEVLKNAKLITLKLIFVQAGATIGFYLFTVYSVSYVTRTLNLSSGLGLAGVLVGTGLLLVLMPAYAALSDRIGRRPVYFAGTLFLGLWALPFFWLLDTREPVLVIVAIAVPMVFGYGPAGALNSAVYSEQYPTRYRYTGVSVAYQTSSLIAGAPFPLVAAALVAATGNSAIVSWYLIIACVISLVCVVSLKETAGTELRTE